MSIISEAVKRIRASVDLCSEGEVQESGGQKARVYIPQIVQGRIHERRPHPEEVLSANEDVLGTYRRMSSPGLLRLHVDSLDSFFWHILLMLYQLHLPITPADVDYLCRLTVLKTYQHEQFHHLCDVARHLFGCVYNKEQEEALAVAYSYRLLRAELKDKMKQPLYAEFMDLVHRYTSPGYRDWNRYVHPDDLKAGLVNYIGPMSAQRLYSYGIAADSILRAIKSSVDTQGVEEQMVDHTGNRVWPVPKAWFVRPDLQPGESVQNLVTGSFISIGGHEIGDLTGQSRARIVELIKTFKHVVSNFHLPSALNPLNAIVNEMSRGDTVYMWLGNKALVGTVDGGYEYRCHRICAPHVRRVIWDISGKRVGFRKLARNGIKNPNIGPSIESAAVGIATQPDIREDIDLF